MLFVKGLAKTGKSSTVKAVANFFAKEDVKVLANNMEDRFGLQGTDEAMLVVAYDIKKDFNLDQAQWQSMVSGEPMRIAIKSKKAKDLDDGFKPGMMFAGNEPPQWTDNADSVARRFLVLQHNERVGKVDTTIARKLLTEIAHFMYKCNRAYLSKVRLWGNEEIHAKIPQYFKKTSRQLQADCQPLTAFLQSDWINSNFSKDKYTSLDDFTRSLGEFCKNNLHSKAPVWKPDLYSGMFQELEIQVVRTTKEYPIGSGKKVEQDYIIGLSLSSKNRRQQNNQQEQQQQPPRSRTATTTFGGIIVPAVRNP
jgi:hypothetical protein